MTEDAIFWGLTTGDKLWTYLGALLMTAALALAAKHLSGRLEGIVQRALREVGDAVREVYQVYVQALKDGRSDGKLTEAEKVQAKQMAIGIAKANIGQKGLARLLRILGIDALDGWLGSKVETAIADAKTIGTAAAGGSSPRPLPR
ncbi:MAG: hypothetical protein WC700_17810 [Gemmatimonadaceae bacterium]|jgi:hypothetical protein